MTQTDYHSDIQSIKLHFPENHAQTTKLEKERQRVLKDLTKRSQFRPENNNNAPYCIDLYIADNKLIFNIKSQLQEELPTLILSLSPYKKIIKDYFMIIDSYEALRSKAMASKLETIDMARRGIHNEAAELMMERLDGKIKLDMDTARGLFTLICVLYISNPKSGWV